MKDYEENGYIEAYLIIEEAYGELITGPAMLGEDRYDYLLAEDKLLGARAYVEEQIPPYLRGTY